MPTDIFYASPRPLTRGKYLVRSSKGYAIIRIIDFITKCIIPARRPSPVFTEPQRILLSNWAHLGDVLVNMPAIRAIKILFPDAEIDLLVSRSSVHLLEKSGLYSRLHLVDHFQLSRNKKGRLSRLFSYLRDRKAFLLAARQRRYDVAIDLYPYFPSASPLFWAAGIPVRCGFTSGGFGSFLTNPVDWSFQGRPMGAVALDLIKALWPDRAKTIGPLSPHDPGLSASLSVGAVVKSSYIVIHSGAGAVWKEWPEEKWFELLDLLKESTLTLVFCGVGARESDRARRLSESWPASRSVLFLDRTWDEFVSLIAHSDGVVCLDSISGHMAAVFSIPTVAIYPGTNELKLWGPDNPRARLITAPTRCAPCHRRGCSAMACVRDVDASDVFNALKQLHLV